MFGTRVLVASVAALLLVPGAEAQEHQGVPLPRLPASPAAGAAVDRTPTELLRASLGETRCLHLHGLPVRACPLGLPAQEAADPVRRPWVRNILVGGLIGAGAGMLVALPAVGSGGETPEHLEFILGGVGLAFGAIIGALATMGGGS